MQPLGDFSAASDCKPYEANSLLDFMTDRDLVEHGTNGLMVLIHGKHRLTRIDFFADLINRLAEDVKEKTDVDISDQLNQLYQPLSQQNANIQNQSPAMIGILQPVLIPGEAQAKIFFGDDNYRKPNYGSPVIIESPILFYCSSFRDSPFDGVYCSPNFDFKNSSSK